MRLPTMTALIAILASFGATTGAIVSMPSRAIAQEVNFHPRETKLCLDRLDEGRDKDDCIGASAEACMENTQGGWSTAGMGACLSAEATYWDGRLNAAYKHLREGARATDKEMSDIGSSAPKQADALRDMQRAWITYRDAACLYEASQWGGGSGGGPAAISCIMYQTAHQALYLEEAGLVD